MECLTRKRQERPDSPRKVFSPLNPLPRVAEEGPGGIKENCYHGISLQIWGKSSLVEKAGGKVLRFNKNIRIIYLDLFKLRDEKEFYEQLMSGIIKNSSSKWEEWMRNVKSFLKGLVTSFSVGSDPYTDFKFQLNWQ